MGVVVGLSRSSLSRSRILSLSLRRLRSEAAGVCCCTVLGAGGGGCGVDRVGSGVCGVAPHPLVILYL